MSADNDAGFTAAVLPDCFARETPGQKNDLKSWRKLAVKPVWHGPGKMLGTRLNGRLAKMLAGRHARGWLKSLWLLALLAVWLSRGMAGVLAACGLVILACVQFLYSV
ncbi:hypothetical protein L1069_12885 [Leisingera sp. MMG025]|nr:hypothetical protein [Leisingera sp. MMG026]